MKFWDFGHFGDLGGGSAHPGALTPFPGGERREFGIKFWDFGNSGGAQPSPGPPTPSLQRFGIKLPDLESGGGISRTFLIFGKFPVSAAGNWLFPGLFCSVLNQIWGFFFFGGINPRKTPAGFSGINSGILLRIPGLGSTTFPTWIWVKIEEFGALGEKQIPEIPGITFPADSRGFFPAFSIPKNSRIPSPGYLGFQGSLLDPVPGYSVDPWDGGSVPGVEFLGIQGSFPSQRIPGFPGLAPLGFRG